MITMETYEQDIHTFLVGTLSTYVQGIKISCKRTEHETHILFYGLDQVWNELAAKAFQGNTLFFVKNAQLRVQKAYLHYEGDELVVRANPLEEESPRGIVVSVSEGSRPWRKS